MGALSGRNLSSEAVDVAANSSVALAQFIDADDQRRREACHGQAAAAESDGSPDLRLRIYSRFP